MRYDVHTVFTDKETGDKIEVAYREESRNYLNVIYTMRIITGKAAGATLQITEVKLNRFVRSGEMTIEKG